MDSVEITVRGPEGSSTLLNDLRGKLTREGWHCFVNIGKVEKRKLLHASRLMGVKVAFFDFVETEAKSEEEKEVG